jgi:tripartite-type tricarboxylate transporter receptor subunit TctC
VRAINLPEVRRRIAELGGSPIANPPAQFASEIDADLARWAEVVRAAGLRVE